MLSTQSDRSLATQAVTLFTVCLLLALSLTIFPAQAGAQSVWPQTAVSKDGVPIAYEQYGAERADLGLCPRLELRFSLLASSD